MRDTIFILYKFVQNNYGGYDKLIDSIYYDLDKCKEGAEKIIDVLRSDPDIKNLYYVNPFCKPNEFTCSWEYLNYDRDTELIRIHEYNVIK